MAKTPTPTEFTVRGSGPFPFDMLRYDQCYPKTQGDTANIERVTRPRERDRHDVTLVSVASSAPTEARWESFGWAVKDR